ncbi:MAG: FHA domain-containing protein [Elusimicrobiota bacterium]
MKRLVITGISDMSKTVLHDKNVVIKNFPYIIGRAQDGSFLFQVMILHNRLNILDSSPYCVSRKHMMIIKKDSRYCVVDLNSTLGTIVNDKLIGKKGESYVAYLVDGNNKVILGQKKSPYTFNLTLSAQ